MRRALLRFLLLAMAGMATSAAGQTAQGISTRVVPAAQQQEVTALFGAYGSNGTSPYDVGTEPPDYESWYAIAVVEMNSPVDIGHAEIADFSLIDDQGRIVKASRILLVEEFDRTRAASEADCAYWMSGDRLRLWDARLPGPTIRLRIRAAFTSSDAAHRNNLVAYRVTIGKHMVEGQFGCRLPS